jgi:hypothetical protein
MDSLSIIESPYLQAFGEKSAGQSVHSQNKEEHKAKQLINKTVTTVSLPCSLSMPSAAGMNLTTYLEAVIKMDYCFKSY